MVLEDISVSDFQGQILLVEESNKEIKLLNWNITSGHTCYMDDLDYSMMLFRNTGEVIFQNSNFDHLSLSTNALKVTILEIQDTVS